MFRIDAMPTVVLAAGIFLLANGCDIKTAPQSARNATPAIPNETGGTNMSDKAQKTVRTDAEWRKILTPVQYHILREKGTEPAFSGKYDEFFSEGAYLCAACGNELFASDAKYNSGCGWPAFTAPAAEETVEYAPDTSHGMDRTEVTCSRCGGHLGHLFKDGPKPTGLRYCINSEALKFEQSSSSDK